MAKTIVGAVLENDPASRNWFNVILNYPGVHAIFFYRINHSYDKMSYEINCTFPVTSSTLFYRD